MLWLRRGAVPSDGASISARRQDERVYSPTQATPAHASERIRLPAGRAGPVRGWRRLRARTRLRRRRGRGLWRRLRVAAGVELLLRDLLGFGILHRHLFARAR